MKISHTDNYVIIQADTNKGICRIDDTATIVTSVAVPNGTENRWIDCDLLPTDTPHT